MISRNKPGGDGMTLRQIADQLGISEYPEELGVLYFTLPDEPACDLELIRQLEAEYGIFGEFYELIMDTAEKINASPVHSGWVRAAAHFSMNGDSIQAYRIPEPAYDGGPMNDLLLLYVLIPQIPGSIAKYRQMGLDEDQLADILDSWKLSLRIVRERTGRPGINKAYYNWMIHFTKARIFKVKGLQFEAKPLPDQAVWIYNAAEKKLVPLMTGGQFHRSGVQQIGSFGYTDDAGAFVPEFSEDDENFYGFGVFDNVVDRQSKAYPKKDWECVGRAGQIALNMHIPRGVDISREATLDACRSGVVLARHYFPEITGSLISCTSWLLNPNLRQVQGANSRITQFMECYTKYPNRDPAGAAMFGFVFNCHRPEDLTILPEDTSLRRKLKKLYLEGGCLHSYSGAIYVEEEK